MKQLMSVLLLTSILFACSDSSTGPGGNDDADTVKPLATETVGTGGGTIAGGALTLSVPSGALAGDTVIGIGETSETSYGNNAASKTYLLSGIPDQFAAPLTLTLLCGSDLTNETFIVAEEVAEDPYGGIVRVPLYLAATASGDSVTAVLPSRAMVTGKAALSDEDSDLLDFYITVVTDYYSTKNATHFKLYVPDYRRTFAESLLPHLDGTYDRIADLGFNLTMPGNTFGPLDTIMVCTEDDVIDPPIFENLLPRTFIGPLMQVQESYLSSYYQGMLKFDSIRSLATLTALYYTKTPSRAPTLWFDLAMADWLARTWYEGTPPDPSAVTGNPVEALKGVPLITAANASVIEDFTISSRRFTPLISYLDSRYNFTGPGHTLAQIYGERYDGAGLASSIETVTGLDPADWWPDFIQAYITGRVWDIDPSAFLNGNAHAGQIILSAADTSHYFSGEFGDIAADIYKITLENDYAESISTLRFSAESSGLQDEYLTVLLFGVRNNKPYYIGRGIDSVIADAGEASDTGTFLAVVASCLLEYPYHRDIPYSLEVTGERGMDSFSQIVLQLPYVWRNYEWVDNDSFTEPAGGAGGMFTWVLTEFEQNGDTYTGTKIETMNSDSWGHYKKTSTITAVITSSLASASITQVTEDYETDSTTTQTFEFWSLPLIAPAPEYLATYGSTTEQFVAGELWPYFTYSYYRVKNTDPEGYTHETTYNARGANIHLR